MKELSPLAELETTAFQRLIQPHRLAELQRSQDAYEMRVFMKARTVSEIVQELDHIVQVVDRSKNFTETRLLLKLYLVSWVSLSDVSAALINEVFDGRPSAQACGTGPERCIEGVSAVLNVCSEPPVDTVPP